MADANNLMRTLLNGGGLRAQLLRGGFGSIILKVVNVGLGLGMAIVLARTLGAEGYGVYTYVLALVSLLSIPAQFGLPNLVVRETAKAEAVEQWGLVRGLWRWAGISAMALSLLLALGGAGAAWLYASQFSTLQLITFGWGLLFVPLLALGSLRGAALRGLRKVIQGQLPEQVIRPALLITFVLVATTFSQHRIDASQAMALHALAAAIAFAIGAWLLQREIPNSLLVKPAPVYESRKWLKAVLPFALIAGMTTLNTQVDVVILGLFKTAQDVGVYRVAARGATLVALGVTAINAASGPYFARFYNTNDMSKLQRLATLSARTNFLLALLATMAFILFGVEIISIAFGQEYVSAYWPLTILAVAQLIRTASGALGHLLNMTGNEKINMKIALCSAICNVVLNLLFIPVWGINGAALATGISMILRRIFSWLVVRHRLGIDGSILGMPSVATI